MNKKDVLSIVGGVVVLVLIIIILGIGFGIWKVGQYQKGVSVLTDKTGYANGDSLKVKIENRLGEKICFSSCYPYYFEKKISESMWKSYSYSDCEAINLVENCINPKEVKAFELVLPTLEKTSHRLAIPVCIECNPQEPFRQEQWFYSDEFTVN